MTASTGWGAMSKDGAPERRMAMFQGWKQRFVGGIALAAAIVLGSTMTATSVPADSGWSWEGAVVGGVIGGLIGPTIDHEHDRQGSVGFSMSVGTFHDGPVFVHRHRAGWHRPPWHQTWVWHSPRVHPRAWHAHPPWYQHRQWHGPRVHVRHWHVHPERHTIRQRHVRQVHRQPGNLHSQHHRHRHVHSQPVHQPPRHAHSQRRHHGHNHNW